MVKLLKNSSCNIDFKLHLFANFKQFKQKLVRALLLEEISQIWATVLLICWATRRCILHIPSWYDSTFCIILARISFNFSLRKQLINIEFVFLKQIFSNSRTCFTGSLFYAVTRLYGNLFNILFTFLLILFIRQIHFHY